MRFSIITICYNDLSNLKNTYKSVIGQTCNDYEWPVIDGNSSDGTSNWLSSLKEKSLIWISENDKGLFDAMNKGTKMAKGNYLIYMNSGDCFASQDILNMVHQNIVDTKPYFIYGDSFDKDENGTLYYRKARKHKNLTRGMFTHHQAMFFKKEVIGNQLYPLEYKVTADYAFIADFLKKCSERNIQYINFPVCVFLLGGINKTKRFQALTEDFKIRKHIMKLNLVYSSFLFFLHYTHTLIKNYLPKITNYLRYK